MAKDEAELNALWDAKVKFDELSLKLAGKDDKEIRETLTRRYKFAIRRWPKPTAKTSSRWR